MDGGLAQMAQCLPSKCKCKVLSSKKEKKLLHKEIGKPDHDEEKKNQ
jgi:hypothetical protein